MGLTLRRRFGFAGGALTAYEDERFKSNARDSSRPGPFGTKRLSAHQQPADQRDRAPAIRPDARHRRDDPARAGRHRPGGRGDDRVRAGRARHREDRGRPAPGGVPALRAQGAGDQARRGRRGPEPRLPLLHQERAARARRARRHPDHGGRPGGDHAHPRAPTPTRRPRSRATPRMAELLHDVLWSSIKPPAAGARAQPRITPAAGPRARDRGARPGAARPRRPLRHRPRAPRAPDRARDPAPARGGGRDLRRPHPRLGPPLRAGPQVRGRGLAEGGSEASGLHRPLRSKPAPIERSRPALTRRTRPHPLAEGPRAASPPPPGPAPTRC